MNNLCVVFAVGDDIVDKIKSLEKNERESFILGFIENDYFEKHFIAVEELSGQWIAIDDLLMRDDKHYREILIGNESDNLLLWLEDYEATIKMKSKLDNLSSTETAKLYNELLILKNIKIEEVHYYEFIESIENMKQVCEAAIMKKGSLLYCLDVEQEYYSDNSEERISSE